MAPNANIRPSRWLIVTAGQSLCAAPAGGTTTFSYKTFNPDGWWYKIRQVGGTEWDGPGVDLEELAPGRVDPLANQALNTALVMCGGTSGVLAGDSAAALYSEMVTYATNRRTAGFDVVVALTISPSTAFSGGQDTIRQAANDLIVADASAAFDAVVDVDVSPLDTPSNTTYYYDGTHFTEAGSQAVADLLGPVILPLLT